MVGAGLLRVTTALKGQALVLTIIPGRMPTSLLGYLIKALGTQSGFGVEALRWGLVSLQYSLTLPVL